MIVFFGIIMIILGEPFLRELDKAAFPATLSFPVYIISRSLMFAVFINVLQAGVRMFVSELTQSFQGISNKILPGSLPAVDCAATYGFAHPNCLIFGFIFGLIGQLISIAGLLIFRSPIMIITGFVPVFFDNATFAVFANKRGGAKAAAIICFASGILQVLGGAFAAAYFQLYKFGGWHGNFDWANLWPAMGVVVKNLSIPGIIICILLMLIVPQLHYRKNKDRYFAIDN
jgi:PTS system ascorbate-specific IIC component